MQALERTLGLTAVVSISIGAMLGSGIFVLPGLAAAKTGSSVWLAYLAAGLCVLPAALSKAELATAMPTSGGTYIYLERAFGPLAGTIAGLGVWVSLLLKSSFALVGCGAYLIAVVDLPVKPTALTLLVVIVALNVLGVKEVGKSLALIVTVSLVSLWVLVIAGAITMEPVEPSRFFASGVGGFLTTMAFVFVSYDGVTKVAAIAEEVKDPGRNLPLGILLSLGVVALLYSTVVVALVELVPMATLTQDIRPIHTLAERIGGHGVGLFFAVLGVGTMASMSNAGVLAASRFPFAMGRDKLLPSIFARVLRERMTPMVAIVATGGAMAAAILLLDVEGMAKLASAFVILIFIAENVAVIVFRESHVQWYKPAFRSPLYPAVQAFGIVSGLVLLGTMGLTAVVAILATAIPGAAVYILYGRRQSKRQGILGRIGRRSDLLAPGSGSDPEVQAPMASRAAVAVFLLGTERSPEVVAEVGASLADGRKVEVMYLREVPEQLPLKAGGETDDWARSLRRRIWAMAEEKSLDVDFHSVFTRDLVHTAHEVTTNLQAEWLVMAWRSRSAQRFLFVNPLGWLVNHLPCNLALFRDAGVRYIRQILVLAEPGPDDALVASTADHIAALEGADVTFARYVATDADPAEAQIQVDYMDQLSRLCTVTTRTLLIRGHKEVEAIAEVSASFDLLVTGAARPGNAWSAAIGSGRDRIKEKAACSVLSLMTPRVQTHESMGKTAAVSQVQEGMRLLDYVDERCVRARLNIRRKDLVFAEIAKTFSAVLPGVSERVVADALWARERAQNTAIGGAMAMPCAILSEADRPYVGVITLAEPVDYQAPDQQPVDLLFVSVAPPGERQTHLQLLYGISKLMHDPLLLERLASAGAKSDIIEVLREFDQEG